MALPGQGCQPSISACDPGCPAQGSAGEARWRRGALMPGEPDAAPPTRPRSRPLALQELRCTRICHECRRDSRYKITTLDISQMCSEGITDNAPGGSATSALLSAGRLL